LGFEFGALRALVRAFIVRDLTRGSGRGPPLIYTSLIHRRNAPKCLPLVCATPSFFSQLHPRFHPSAPPPRRLWGAFPTQPMVSSFPYDLILELSGSRCLVPSPLRPARGDVCATHHRTPTTVTHTRMDPCWAQWGAGVRHPPDPSQMFRSLAWGWLVGPLLSQNTPCSKLFVS
jgi:hypothetical protein